METRRLHTLTRNEAIDCVAVHTQHATDTNGVEPAAVDQTPNRFGMHAELIRDVTNAHELLLWVR